MFPFIMGNQFILPKTTPVKVADMLREVEWFLVQMVLELVLVVSEVEINDTQFPRGEYNVDDVIDSIIRNWKVLRFERGDGIFGVLV